MKNRKLKYLDSHLSVEVRGKDLIRRMTLEEKIQQLCAIFLPEDILENGKFSFEKSKKIMGKGLGQISAILRPFEPKEGAKLAAWKRDHPTKNPVLHIEGDNPKKLLKSAIATLEKEIDKTVDEFKKLK